MTYDRYQYHPSSRVVLYNTTNLGVEIGLIVAFLMEDTRGDNNNVLFLAFQVLCDFVAGLLFSDINTSYPIHTFWHILWGIGARRACDNVVLGSILLDELETETARGSNNQHGRHRSVVSVDGDGCLL